MSFEHKYCQSKILNAKDNSKKNKNKKKTYLVVKNILDIGDIQSSCCHISSQQNTTVKEI